MDDLLIDGSGLGRVFGRRQALEGVDLTLSAGRIIALAGPNGSGKTTLLNIIAGLLRPTSGSVRIFGLDPFRRRTEVMRRAGFDFAPPPLYDILTAREHLRFLSAAGAGRRDRPDASQIDAALRIVGLAERAEDKVRTFSFALRQRLALAQGLVPTPRLLVLDEPTDGLDRQAILELRNILRQLCDEHRMSILLSSHLLIELERLADHLLVLNEGRALFITHPPAVDRRHPPDRPARRGKCEARRRGVLRSRAAPLRRKRPRTVPSRRFDPPR